ncbi:LysR family transcriptional regulator [Planctobacterium marinum]|uniref:LysR family transcriptional regulator n=1 Tax=Planctobacterium marinum TaxID=1631968 RepID=A0AA48KT60_9ALTE|nr:LysR family transcriptional regulator [Planctobacterium marinum]
MKQLSLENLRTFVTVVELDGFSRAGEVLGRSQPAVSLQIKKLEEQLGTRLFQKQGQRQVVNHAGQKLYELAIPLLKQNDHIFQFFAEKPVSGNLRLGIPSEFATQLLPSIIGSFNNMYPDVTLEVTSSLSASLLEKHRSKPFDLLLTIAAQNDAEIHAEAEGFTLTDELVWVGSEKQAINQSSVDLVVAPEGCRYREQLLRSLNSAGLHHHIRYTISDITGISAAIQQGLGITALAKSTVPDNLVIIENTALPPLGKIAIQLSVRHQRNKEATDKLAEFIRTRLAVNLSH